MRELTPSEIVKQLDKYIVGQDSAKRSVAVALRNRYRRRRLPEELQEHSCSEIKWTLKKKMPHCRI